MFIPVKDLKTNENKLLEISKEKYDKILKQIKESGVVFGSDQKLIVNVDKDYNIKIVSVEPK